MPSVIILQIALASTLIVVAGLAFAQRQSASRRTQRIRGVTNRAAGQSNIAKPTRTRRRKELVKAGMRMVKRFSLFSKGQDDEVDALIRSAGYRTQDAGVIFSFFKLALPIALVALVAMWSFGFGGSGKGFLIDLMIALAAGLVSSRAPEFYLSRKRNQRLKDTAQDLPDVLDMLVVCTEAGLGFDSALRRVVGEMKGRDSTLADELSYTVTELGLIPERDEVFEALARRLPSAPVIALINTLLQTERFGTPLARALRVLSDELRIERSMAAEQKAAQLPAIMTVPLMVFILPPIFIILIGPAILTVISTIGGR